MKILYVTTSGGTMNFFKSFLHELISKGDSVDIATNETISLVPECYREWGCKVYPISCTRSVFCSGNLKAIKELKKLVTRNRYDLVHCHTPIAAACTRVACQEWRKKGGKVIYTAHGFHFFRGAPLKNWLLYYPVEKFLSHWTDCLITINREDYKRAKRKLHTKQTEYVPGVGIDLEKFHIPEFVKNSDGILIPYPVWREGKRNELGLGKDDIVIISVGELNSNKNHKTMVKVVAELKNERVKYLICGQGRLRDGLGKLVKKLGLEKQVFLLGFRDDIRELLWAGDLFAFPSRREGLPVALMEAMASGMPCIAGDIRGNQDLFSNGKEGYLLPVDRVKVWKEKIQCCIRNLEEERNIAKKDITGMEIFSASKIEDRMKKIYHML
ncbi:MAG: glycosyltransferase family 4 protein [Lachnospiraceae bacterium]|nr:glycosyltransferase family 4 protein [Lachnospiraceae bacterium]